MTKTFEEIINEEFNFKEIHLLTSGDEYNIKKWALKLMQFVRIKTLEEAVSKAKVDYTCLGLGDDSFIEDSIEVYVINSSILNLDKNSIEI